MLDVLIMALALAQGSARITFWSDRAGDPDVFAMNTDGSGVRNLGRQGWGDKRASWSPDGQRIVYDSWHFDHADFDLWLMNPDGNGKTQLTTSPLRDVLPAWSPDGRWIAFARRRANSNVEDLWLIRPDGSDEHLLTRGGGAPAWSPASRRIAFASHAGDLWVIGVDGKNRRRLTRTAAFESPSAGSWSPDGTKLLFTHWPLGRFGDVYALTLRTGKIHRLTSARGDDTDPSWSPDGKQILFDSTRDGNREVYVMNADGSAQRNLTHNPAEDWADTWQPRWR